MYDVEFYQAMALAYLERTACTKLRLAQVEKMVDPQPGDKIVDLGCGMALIGQRDVVLELLITRCVDDDRRRLTLGRIDVAGTDGVHRTIEPRDVHHLIVVAIALSMNAIGAIGPDVEDRRRAAVRVPCIGVGE